MKLGAVFPQSEIGNDPNSICKFAQGIEGLGLSHLLVYDHVLGANPDRPGGWEAPYDMNTSFHEPLVLFGYLAGVTKTLELATTVLILPQRQAALVAKQATEVQNLSRGRLRLGVGTGWNKLEYEGLGVPFEERGLRQEEQLLLMQDLWEQSSLSFEGKFHRIDRAGINPRPETPIPIWFGGSSPALIRRTAKLGDGWMPLGTPKREAVHVEQLNQELLKVGRDPREFGIQAQAQARGGNPERWRLHAESWRDLGATHLALATMNANLSSVEDHLQIIAEWRDALTS